LEKAAKQVPRQSQRTCKHLKRIQKLEARVAEQRKALHNAPEMLADQEREYRELLAENLYLKGFRLAGAELHDAYEVLGVLDIIPEDLLDFYHRALAKKYHPDTGGNPQKMAEINAAVSTIKRLRAQAKRKKIQ
jgi:hypothetical protein